MARLRPLGKNGDITRSFASEDGAHYRHSKQELDGAIKHVEHLRHKVNEAPRSGNKGGWAHAGSIPFTVLVDWLNKNGYTIDQWARNEGGDGNATVHNYKTDRGVKAQFLRYFLSRDYAKLHNMHVTTKRESVVHTIPAGIKRQAVELNL